MREPVDLFSESCDAAQLEEMDVVSSTIQIIYGSYTYTYDDYITNPTYYYVLPIDTAGQTYYMGIRETKGRKEQFRKLSVHTEFDVKAKQTPFGNPLQADTIAISGQVNEEGQPIVVEGFLYRMDEYQYGRFLAWLEKAGYIERVEPDGELSKTQQEQVLPYYIVERDIAKCKKACVNGLIWTAVSIVLIISYAAVLIRWRKKHSSQTHVSIGNQVYIKEQLAGVNQLIERVELIQAVQELSRITGLDMLQAEKIVRHWYAYWY